MKKVLLTISSLLVLSLPAWAAELDHDSVCEAIDENESIDLEVLEKINLEARNIGDVVEELVIDRRIKVKRAVRYSLLQYPAQVNNIVGDSLDRGATTEDIAVQCDCDISDQIVPDLVGSAIAHGADTQTMMTRCMRAMRAGNAYLLVEAALANADPADIELVLATALRSIHFSGPEGRDQLVNLLIDGDHMLRGNERANCGANCQHPAALTLINYLSEQVSVEPASPGQASINPDLVDYLDNNGGNDDDDNEPPLSDD